jgi:hypothetical protein
VLPSDLAALAVSGVTGLAVVGLLAFRMRAALIRLRQGRREMPATAPSTVPAVPSSTPVSSAAPDARASGPGPWHALAGTDAQDPPGATTETAGAAERQPDEAYSPTLTRDMLPPWPAYLDATGPLPIFDYVVRQRYPHREDQGPGI